MLSVLLSLMIVSSLSILTLNVFDEPNVEHLNFINEYLEAKCFSLVNKEETDLNEYGIHFNSSGHINMAQTIKFKNHNVIVHLGNGYLSYE